MDRLALQDLVEGRNEWCNIPDVIRETLKDFSILITNQAAQIRALDETIAILQKPRKRDERLLALESEVLDVSKATSRNRNSIETLQARVASKAEASEVHDRLAELKRSFEGRLAAKADTVHVNTGLASRVPLRIFEEQIEARVTHDSLAVALDAAVRGKADLAAVDRMRDAVADLKTSKVGAHDLEEILNLALADRALNSDLAAVVADIRAALDRKADAALIESELARKADSDTVQRLAAEKGNAHQLLALLEAKADIAYVNQELAAKADDATVTRALGGKASRAELDALLVAKVDADDVNDLLNKHLGQVSDAVAAYKRDVQLGLKSRASIAQVNDMFAQVSKDFNSLVLSLDLKLDRSEFVDAMDAREDALRSAVHDKELEVAHHTEAINVINSQLLQLSRELGSKSDAETLNRALASFRKDLSTALAETKAAVAEKASERMLASGLARKLERADVEEMLASKADVHDVALELSLKANVDDIDSMLSSKASAEALLELSHMAQELRAGLEAKANRADTAALVASKASIDDLSALRSSIARIEKVVGPSSGSGRGGDGGGGRASSSGLGSVITVLESDVTRLRQALIELQADLEAKVEASEFHAALASKADVRHVDDMIETTSRSFQSSLDLKASLGELQSVRGDTVELGNQLVSSSAETQSLFSSSLDSIRRALDTVESKVARKADVATLESSLASVASRDDFDALSRTLRAVQAELKRKADGDEMLSALHAKVDQAQLSAALDPLPTHAQLLDGLNAKVDHAELASVKDFLQDTKLDRNEWLMDKSVTNATNTTNGNNATNAIDSQQYQHQPRGHAHSTTATAPASYTSSSSASSSSQVHQYARPRAPLSSVGGSKLELNVAPIVDARTRALGSSSLLRDSMIGRRGAGSMVAGEEGDLLIQTSHRLQRISGASLLKSPPRPFAGLQSTPQSLHQHPRGENGDPNARSYAYILSSNTNNTLNTNNMLNTDESVSS